jgi:hypothetical protein
MDNLPINSKFAHFIQPYDENVIANMIDSNAMLTTSMNVSAVEDLTPRIADMMSSSMTQYNNTFASIGAFLRGSGRVEEVAVDAREVKWKLMGDGHFHARIVENLNENIQFVGVGGVEFPLKFDVDWWVEGDVLTPVLGKEKINVRLTSGPDWDGTGYLYNAQLVDMDEDRYLNQTFLEVNRKWIKLFASAGEATSLRGSFQGTGPAPTWVELQNKLTHLTKKVKITDEAMKTSDIIVSQEKRFLTKGPDGNPTPNPTKPFTLMNGAEQEFIMQTNYEKDLANLYGRHNGNRNIDRSSSFVVDQGAGLYEFLRTGNTMEVPVTSYAIDMLIDAIKSRWNNKVSYGNRNVVIHTGEGGLDLAQDYFQRKLVGTGAQIRYIDITTGNATTYGSGYEGRKLKTSYITELQLFPWGTIKFMHQPMFDDLTLNAGAPTYKGRPHASYSFIVLDYGLGSGPSSNVTLLSRKGMRNYNYVCGMWSPAGPINNMRNVGASNWVNGGHAGNYFELHYDDWTGIIMKDASRSIYATPALKTV